MKAFRTFALVTSCSLALAACGSEDQTFGSGYEGEAAETVAADAQASPAQEGETAGTIPVTLPRMAYVFENAFRLPGDAIAPLQARHADMCEALGPTRCMIVGMSASGTENEASGRLELAVAADRARGFVGELSALVPAYQGEQVSAQVTGEDLSKSMVDTEARLRTRTDLRDRLQEVLRTRRGTVEELVEAERQVAAINEEIDQARSWMAEMRGRVNFARVVVTYESSTPAGSSFLQPVGDAFGSLEGILGHIVALLVLVSGVVGPFVLGALGLRHLLRRRELAAARDG